MLECVLNVSEGRDHHILAALDAAAGSALLDRHTDPHHNRSVLTLAGADAGRTVTRAAVGLLDLTHHRGVHPRMGVVDVVPFVALEGHSADDAVEARDAFARWAAAELGLPCFLYGPISSGVGRTLPEVRRAAFADLAPDHGPPDPHPTAGASAVGARDVLVAYNLWLSSGADLTTARAIAGAIRSPAVRALGLQVGDRVQVSMNLVAPTDVGPAGAWDLVIAQARDRGARIAGAELVGLVPDAVLRAAPRSRWDELDLAADRTIEARYPG